MTPECRCVFAEFSTYLQSKGEDVVGAASMPYVLGGVALRSLVE